jgi:hypothetical protein
MKLIVVRVYEGQRKIELASRRRQLISLGMQIRRADTASSDIWSAIQFLPVFRNPTPRSDPSLEVTWTPVTKTEFHYLNIDKKLTMQKDLAKDRMAFWEDLLSSL